MLKVYKLTTGEDIIGNVIEESEEGFFMEDPVSYWVMPNGGFQMKDWMILVQEENVFVQYKHIMMDLGYPNDFGAQCYESFVKHRKKQRDYLHAALEQREEELELTEENLSDDVREILYELQPPSDKQKLH